MTGTPALDLSSDVADLLQVLIDVPSESRQEEAIAEIVHSSGILKGRTPWRREAATQN